MQTAALQCRRAAVFFQKTIDLELTLTLMMEAKKRRKYYSIREES
jgi:hypothetical protein